MTHQSRIRNAMLYTEAFLLLSTFRVSLAILPVKCIVRLITRRRDDAILCCASSAFPTNLKIILEAIQTVVQHSKIKFVCFPQSLAGYVMLRRRRIHSTIVYGIRRHQGRLISHTWLKRGDEILIGGEGAENFAEIAEWF